MKERQLRMTYDAEADAAFIYLTDPIRRGEAVKGGTLDTPLDGAAVNASFDSEGHLLGIELLGVSRLLRSDALPDR